MKKLNLVSKQALSNMYAEVIRYFHDNDLEDEEKLSALFATLDTYELAVPESIYKTFIDFLVDNLGDNLPEIDVSGIAELTEDGLNFKTEEDFREMWRRDMLRTIEIHNSFVAFAKKEFAELVQE